MCQWVADRGPQVAQLQLQRAALAPRIDNRGEGDIERAATSRRLRHLVASLKGDDFQSGAVLFHSKARVLTLLAEAPDG